MCTTPAAGSTDLSRGALNSYPFLTRKEALTCGDTDRPLLAPRNPGTTARPRVDAGAHTRARDVPSSAARTDPGPLLLKRAPRARSTRRPDGPTAPARVPAAAALPSRTRAGRPVHRDAQQPEHDDEYPAGHPQHRPRLQPSGVRQHPDEHRAEGRDAEQDGHSLRGEPESPQPVGEMVGRTAQQGPSRPAAATRPPGGRRPRRPR